MNHNRKVISGAVITGMLAVATTVANSNPISAAEASKQGVTAGIFADLEKITNGEATTAEKLLSDKTGTMTIARAGAFAHLDGSLSEVTGKKGLLAGLEEMTESLEASDDTTEEGVSYILNMDTDGNAVAEAEEAAKAEAPADEVEEAAPEEAAAEEPAPVVEEAAEPELSEEEQEWQDKLITTVEESLNIRADANEEAEIVGKLYAGAAADVLERGDEWTHISSGDVQGYVCNEYCLFGSEAYQYAQENCPVVAKTVTEGLRLRSDAGEDAGIISTLEEGTSLYVSKKDEDEDGWLYVNCDGTDGYVSEDYVEVSMQVGEAISIEEEQARIAEEEAKKAEEAKQSSETKTTNSGGISASADDVSLLAALIQCEAGSEPYEGQVAVGACVMNRLRSGAYGGSIYSVIYAPGQFTPAGSGQVAAVLASGGAWSSCVSAAQEALSGVNNIGGCLYFRNVRCGHDGLVIGSHVFW